MRPDTEHLAAAYNLTINGMHTYFVGVGSNHVLVHNDCGEYIPRGAAADFELDELAQLTHQHVGAGDIAGRPSFDQIRSALDTEPRTLAGQNAVQFEHGGVRVIINEDQSWRSTAYFPDK